MINTGPPPNGGGGEASLDAAERVVVAAKISKVIPRAALVWALTHVVQPGGFITLLVVVPAPSSGSLSHILVSPWLFLPQTIVTRNLLDSSGKKLWGFPKFAGDCASGHRRFLAGNALEIRSDIADTCSQMMLQLQEVYDPNKVLFPSWQISLLLL